MNGNFRPLMSWKPFNRKKKGQRSYYPLFCTVAQTGQVLGVLHRSGNVHDSNGADRFIAECIEQIRAYLPRVIIELRMDSAFFSDGIVTMLEQANVEYTISVPFERFTSLKSTIEERQDANGLPQWSRKPRGTFCGVEVTEYAFLCAHSHLAW